MKMDDGQKRSSVKNAFSFFFLNSNSCQKYCLCVPKHSEWWLFTHILFASGLSQAADESSEEASFYEILPCCARFRCGEVIAEGQWHHLVLVMSKGMLKNSMATLYIDGQLINTVKVRLHVNKIIQFQEIVYIIIIVIIIAIITVVMTSNV